jgi:hypothetical protein
MKKNKFILCLLAFIFIAPSLSAYLLYQHPSWRSHQTTNKGKLISDAPTLPIFDEKKWHIIYWHPKSCSESCLNNLKQLSQLRLALGRRYYHVDLWLVSFDSNLSAPIHAYIKEQHIRWIAPSSKDERIQSLTSYTSSVFIATPQDHLILRYLEPLKLEDIYKDIKHLLTTSDGNNVS